MICYKDQGTFVTVEPDVYSNTKSVQEQVVVEGDFFQDTTFLHSNHQDVVGADAAFFADPTNEWIISKHYRLEGMYFVEPLFDGDPAESWYKVIKVTVNRGILLCNDVDTVQILLKKTRPVPGFS